MKDNNKKGPKRKKTKKQKKYNQKKMDLDYYTVKIPIMGDFLTDKKLMQLKSITHRDTTHRDNLLKSTI